MNPQSHSDDIESLLARSPQISDQGFSELVLIELRETNTLKQRLLIGAGLVWGALVLFSTSATELWQLVLDLSNLYLGAIAAAPELSTSITSEASALTLVAVVLALISLLGFTLQR